MLDTVRLFIFTMQLRSIRTVLLSTAFHIMILRYRTICTGSVQRQVGPVSAIQSSVQCYPPSFPTSVWRVAPQAHTDHRGRAPATTSAAAANRNRDCSAPASSKHNSHCSDGGPKWHGFCVFQPLPTLHYIMFHPPHNDATSSSATSPHPSFKPTTHRGPQAAAHGPPTTWTSENRPTAPTPLVRPVTGVHAHISCDDNAGEWTDQTRDHRRRHSVSRSFCMLPSLSVVDTAVSSTAQCHQATVLGFHWYHWPTVVPPSTVGALSHDTCPKYCSYINYVSFHSVYLRQFLKYYG